MTKRKNLSRAPRAPEDCGRVTIDPQNTKVVWVGTGEERLREFMTELYANVVFYEGRPSRTQVERADALARELADVVRDFDAWTSKELSGLNTGLAAKNLAPLKPLSREEWEKVSAPPASSASPAAVRRMRDEY